MRSSRALFDAATTASKRPLFSNRSQFDILSSAFGATMSIFSSQTDRDKFLNTVDKGIINPTIMANVDMGFSKSLALYHDLNNDLFQKNGFDIEEFLEGAEPAIERYHEVLRCLENETNAELLKELNCNHEEYKKTGSSELIINLEDGKGFNGLRSSYKSVGDWKRKAQDDPESLYGQLQSMVSEPLMQMLSNDYVRAAIYNNDDMPPIFSEIRSVEVKSVSFLSNRKEANFNFSFSTNILEKIALLSARAREVFPDDDTTESDDEEMVDDSLLDEINTKVPVAAEIAVIYEILKTKKTEIIPEMKLHEWHAIKFETMLCNGTDDSQDSMRWKIILGPGFVSNVCPRSI